MDDFSDDDFDTLNADTLRELENKAIQFTQAQKKYDPPGQTGFEYDLDDDDLDDAVVQDAYLNRPAALLPPEKSAQLSARIVPRQPDNWGPVPIPASRLHPPPVNPRPSQQSGPHAQPYPRSQVRPPPPIARPPVPPIPSRNLLSQVPRPNVGPGPGAGAGASSHHVAQLQAQIQDLKTKYQTKDGEVGIVRNQLKKLRDEHDREVQAIRKQATEQVTQLQRALDAEQNERQAAVTDLEFTKRDHREELSRAKRVDADGGTPTKKNAAAKSWGIADGFEDVEMASSPTKGRRGKNVGPVAGSVVEPPPRLPKTPTKGKRKRPLVDSPVIPLDTHTEDVVMVDAGPVDPFTDHQLTKAPSSATFNYMKVIIGHSSAHGRPMTFDYLSGFTLRCRSNKSLSSILFDKLSAGSDSDDAMRLPIEFCEEVISLWRDCRREDCLAPIAELVSLVSVTLQLQTVAIAPKIAASLLPEAMGSCYEVAIPRFNNPGPGEPTTESFKRFRDNIPTTEILSLLYLTAMGCASSSPVAGSLASPAVEFWSMVEASFVLHLLSQKQPVEDFLVTLRWLGTSVFHDIIGPIGPDRTTTVTARTIIERVSVHLAEVPRRWDIDLAELRRLQIAMLQSLAAFARSPFALMLLAQMDWVIPRLVSLLSSCIDELYNGDMHYNTPPPSGNGNAEHDHDNSYDSTGELQTLVAHATLLLHTVITNPTTAEAVDVVGKMAKVTGGWQKYLLSLARLNFSEDLVSEETAELAHELLEMAVTAEEGEQLGEFFGG